MPDMTKVSIGLTAATCVYAALLQNSTVPHDVSYYRAEVRNTELIYPREHLQFARETAGVEGTLQPLYEAMYGYTMDETLFVGLLSDCNQIANGYSTPYPNNRQINYPGGVLMVDYFASPSWLKTLLYHETAHNYQMNAKDSPVSQGLHDVIGNGWLFVPWFTLPNITESRFLIEGNAVLNESWHGNGGRLYSGRFKAATLQQAKAGRLTPERVYNDNYFFLYGSHHYTLGGYYQSYLAETYGLESVNAYWRAHSREWFWPFFTNRSTEASVGVDFGTAFDGWRKRTEAEAAEMTDVGGDAVASTQFYSPISGDGEAIYFIVNENGREFPERVVYGKSDGKVTTSRGSYIAGKVVRRPDGQFATQGSAYTSPWRIYAGLYDDDAVIVDGTQSKVIEGYLHDGTPVYFDVPGSFDQPRLYVGGTYYGRVNSSVFIDGDDNLYYFVQGKNKRRTLYRNKTPLCTISGYYGNVSGVDSGGAVYFIANTPHGSGLFRCKEGKMTRAHAADTIIEARLIDDHHALAAVMGPDAYRYKKIILETIDETPYEVSLFVEHEPYYHADDAGTDAEYAAAVGLEHPYRSLTAMHYSGTDLAFGIDSSAGFVYDLAIRFADPLTRNALSAFALRNLDEYTLGGLSYANSQYFLQFALSAYGVIDRPENGQAEADRRDYGLIVQTALPFLREGYGSATLYADYYQDYESRSRKPLSAALELKRSEQYGVSLYSNFLLSVSPYAASDRGDTAFGGAAVFEYGLPRESYAHLDFQYSASDADTAAEARGVKLAPSPSARFKDGDPTTVIMPSLSSTVYLRSVSKSGAELKKVFNLSSYFFTFPFSLRREAFLAGYHYYALEPFGGHASRLWVNEASAGLLFDTLWFHKLPVPVTIDYFYNDTPELADWNTVRFGIGIAF